MGEQKVKTLAGDDLKSLGEVKGKKGKRKVTSARVYIHSTYNNTLVTLTDNEGAVLSWDSAGMVGFRGSKKSTPYAAQKTMEEMIKRMKDMGVKELDVYVKGVGTGRESAVRALNGAGIMVNTIRDTTPIPHGGVRKKKPSGA